MTKFKRGCQAQSRSYKRGGAKGYGANRGRAHGALESGRRADGDRRGGGTGRTCAFGRYLPIPGAQFPHVLDLMILKGL